MQVASEGNLQRGRARARCELAVHAVGSMLDDLEDAVHAREFEDLAHAGIWIEQTHGAFARGSGFVQRNQRAQAATVEIIGLGEININVAMVLAERGVGLVAKVI